MKIDAQNTDDSDKQTSPEAPIETKETDKLEEEKVGAGSIGIKEPEAEDTTPIQEEKQSKFVLLDRLMKFIRQKEKPLNSVLAGYFSKLLTLLINRKSKMLLPYVFAPESDVIECLLYHIYQKSISELVNKFLTLNDDTIKPNEESILAEIKAKQHHILNTLVEKLGPNDTTEEDNLNASYILQDSLETKDYFNVVSKRNNILKLLHYAFPEAD